MTKYLVSGGAGFIGSNIVKTLLELEEFVRVVDNFSTGKKENIEEFISDLHFELIEGDLTDLKTARQSVEGIDFVLHEAAVPSVQRSIKDPLEPTKANVIGTLNLLIAARDQGVKRFVFASSSSIYGDSPTLPKREDFPVNPLSPYALTKYAGERYVQLFWRLYRFPAIALRYFNVFGPKQDPSSQYSAVIPKFISSILKGENPVIYGKGDQSRDFTFVDNVVQANLLAAKAEKGFGEVFNIACGKRIDLNQLVLLLSDIIGARANPQYSEPRKGDVLHSLADISKAKEVLNYRPKVKLKQGLIRTVEWLKENG